MGHEKMSNPPRPLRMVEYQGETHHVSEWARRLGIPKRTLHGRLYQLQWSVEKAFTEPLEVHIRKPRPTRIYHPLYGIWRGIWRRCTDAKEESYPNYGGRGIKVCDAWRDFFQFCKDMGPRPPGLTIERINNDGDYTAENCKWATYKEQKRNTRTSHLITYNGETHCLLDWAEILGITRGTLRNRLVRNKWPVHKAFTQPVDKRKATALGKQKKLV
jgi:hypothetical protein